MKDSKFLCKLPNGNMIFADNLFEYSVLTNNHMDNDEMTSFFLKLSLWCIILCTLFATFCAII